MEGSILAGFILGTVSAVAVALSLSVTEKPGNEIFAYSIYVLCTFFVIGNIFSLENVIVPILIVLIILVAFGNKLTSPLAIKVDEFIKKNKLKRRMLERDKYCAMSLEQIFLLHEVKSLNLELIRGYLFEQENDFYNEFGINVDEQARYKEFLDQDKYSLIYHEFHQRLMSLTGNPFVNGYYGKQSTSQGGSFDILIDNSKTNYQSVDHIPEDGNEASVFEPGSNHQENHHDFKRIKKTEQKVKIIKTSNKEIEFDLYDELPREEIFN